VKEINDDEAKTTRGENTATQLAVRSVCENDRMSRIAKRDRNSISIGEAPLLRRITKIHTQVDVK